MAIERRPDHRGYSATTFPPEWGDDIPEGLEARERWAAEKVRAGLEQRAQGVEVPWLMTETRA